jgi:hypothetical protein
MSESPTAEKAYTTLKALQLSVDDDEIIMYSSGRMGSSIVVGMLLSISMSMWMIF